MGETINTGAAATGEEWRDRWETPRPFADEVARELGVWWALDAAADDVNHVGWDWYTAEADALSIGGWQWVIAATEMAQHLSDVGEDCDGRPAVWLNPPYSELRHGKWGREAIECARHGGTVAMLVPSSLTVGWAHDILSSGWVDLILMPRGRVSFSPPHDAPEGVVGGSPINGTCVLVLGLLDIPEEDRVAGGPVLMRSMYRSAAERVAATAQGVLL